MDDLFGEILQMAAVTEQKKQDKIRTEQKQKEDMEKKRELEILDRAHRLANKVATSSRIEAIVGKPQKKPAVQKSNLSFEELMRLAEKNAEAPVTESTDKKEPPKVEKPMEASQTFNRNIMPQKYKVATNKNVGPPSRAQKVQKQAPSKPWKRIEKPKSAYHASIDPNEMITLNTKKRDLRTIEEIQAEIQRKKNPVRESVSRVDGAKPKPRKEVPKKKELEQSQTSPSTSSKGHSKHTAGRPVREVPRKRDTQSPRLAAEDIADPLYVKQNLSSIISGIFGTKRHLVPQGYDDDIDDMEASVRDIQREESRSARIGKLEDKREAELQRLEKERASKRAKKG